MLNTPFPCLCSTGHHEYCAYCCAWASLPCILNTVFSEQWLLTIGIHSFSHSYELFEPIFYVYYYIFIILDTLLLQPEGFHCRNCTKDILKYSSSINIGGILNTTSAPQNTITTYEKAEIVSQYSSTQLDGAGHTASLTPHYKSLLLLNFWWFILVCVTSHMKLNSKTV